MKNNGQIILILILVMTVALAIGLSIVQKSLVDVSTSSKVEQSSRAFSAAEAGIEKALLENTITSHSTPSFADNSSQVISISDTGLTPCVPGLAGCPQAITDKQVALEDLVKVEKTDIYQAWLADFSSTANPPPVHYKKPALEVYWGNSAQDLPAIELTVVYWDATNNVYSATNTKWYLDPVARNNGFTKVNCNGGNKPNGGLLTYQCKVTLGIDTSPLPPYPILLRARMLYKASQPIAIGATEACGRDCSIPPQARIIVSTGLAGETQRRVMVSQKSRVVPPFLDYAIFSAGAISK